MYPSQVFFLKYGIKYWWLWNSNLPQPEFEFDKVSLFGYQDNDFTILLF